MAKKVTRTRPCTKDEVRMRSVAAVPRTIFSFFKFFEIAIALGRSRVVPRQARPHWQLVELPRAAVDKNAQPTCPPCLTISEARSKRLPCSRCSSAKRRRRR